MKDTKVKEKKWNIWHILGFHKYTKCIEYGDCGLGGETKIEFSSPWAMWGTRYTRYQCTECGRKFWMPKGNFEEIKMQEEIMYRLINNKK
jgi:hypothetical protein